ncbi:hypothetical protein [Simiduia aestuariiviva]|uniref:TRAP-type C4-dicarboxylate transport system permease small subunit n=1 Tax=Simiduia aestuariiviva TaxID=1510459 RepID=A0A839UME2_9GAMM|nr:hypothetical protein [Simiduia aestuariiviva]MBB3169022.1 TRAP-type C4-dicarboxylate transport system permease small subunit [Simiduia aestuariiviva]
MSPLKLLAVILIVLGVLGLAYGGFSYTSDVHDANIGSLRMSFSESEHVNIPIWAGIAFIVVGGLLLTVKKKF